MKAKQEGKRDGASTDFLHKAVSQATPAHGGTPTATQSGWREFPCPCSD